MEKIIKQSSLIILAGIMAFSLGCGGGRGPFLPGSSSDFAPTSISGETTAHTITSGSGDYGSSGTFTLTFTATTFVLTGGPGIADESGSYVYTRNSGTSGTIALTRSAGGLTTAALTFSSATAGSYVVTGSAGLSGTQTGTFTL
jgi:hypothetical protein